MGRVATFGNMDPEKTWNEMAFRPQRPSPVTGFQGSQGPVPARGVLEGNLAIGQLRWVARRTTPRLLGEQGRAMVRFRPGHPDETGETPSTLRSVDPATGVLAGRTVARSPIGFRGRRELQHLRDTRRRRYGPQDHGHDVGQRLPTLVSGRQEDRVHLKPGRRPRQRLRRRGDGRRDEATHERRRYRDGNRMAAGWEEHRLLRRGRAPRLRRAGESRRPHEEGRRIPGFGELDRWRPRDSQAVVSGWPRARLRVERP